MIPRRSDLIITVGFLALCLSFAIYSALMLSNSSRRLEEFRQLALKNQKLMIENQQLFMKSQLITHENQRIGLSVQAIGMQNQQLFKERIKHEEDLAASVKVAVDRLNTIGQRLEDMLKR